MTQDYAMNALTKLHAELGGKIKDNIKEAENLREAMMHVEAVIKLLKPEYNVHGIAAKRRNHWSPMFKRGQVFPRSLAILRENGKPMTAKEVTEELMRRYSISNPTRRQYDTIWSLVNGAFRAHPEAVRGIDANPRKWEAKPQG